MNQKGNLAPKIALIVGIMLLLGAIAFLIVKLVQAQREAREEDEPIAPIAPKAPGQVASAAPVQNHGSELIKKMQSYLLNVGIINNNNEIIDAIRLTGGIDGIRGNGFDAALRMAIEKGYVKSYDDLLNRVS